MSDDERHEPVDAVVLEPGHELARTTPPAGLFRTDDPVEVIEKATAVADALKDVLRKQRLLSTISGREFVKVEGWTVLGAMLGVSAVCTATETLPDGFRATVEARMPDGRVVGSADALCTRKEKSWKSRDDYALLSMAQTRATSKALRIPLGFVVALAGFEVTPAEEMPSGRDEARERQSQARSASRPLTREERQRMVDMIAEKGLDLAAVLTEAGVDALLDTTLVQAQRVKVILERDFPPAASEDAL